MPRSGTDYTHRIGRTGRAGEEGLAVALVSSNDWSLMSSIERFLKVRLERRKLAGLEARYKGPKKLKSSGKAAGSKKKKNKKNAAKMGVNSKKAKPKKSGQSESRESSEGDRSKQGFSPLKKKTKN
jgi:superfamily II DNA/RNA helicase